MTSVGDVKKSLISIPLSPPLGCSPIWHWRFPNSYTISPGFQLFSFSILNLFWFLVPPILYSSPTHYFSLNKRLKKYSFLMHKSKPVQTSACLNTQPPVISTSLMTMDQLLDICILHASSWFPLCSSDLLHDIDHLPEPFERMCCIFFILLSCEMSGLELWSLMVILYITFLLCLEFLVSIISNPFLITRLLSRLYHISD